MATKNQQNLDRPADEVLADFLFEKLPTDILVEILRHRISTGRASVSGVIQGLVEDKEAAVIILKRENR
ncbi:MAG: hypothetical protein A4E28_00175 [Methanocella sp. PtaU1.Bin125]|nr:MAG: hypothetical protein A4E28_00175 [Methanocella sp. PtaU1.Bin125]